MERDSHDKSFITCLEDIWEEVEIQFYGITGAIIFFVLVYLCFHPPWMKPLIQGFYNIRFSY